MTAGLAMSVLSIGALLEIALAAVIRGRGRSRSESARGAGSVSNATGPGADLVTAVPVGGRRRR